MIMKHENSQIYKVSADYCKHISTTMEQENDNAVVLTDNNRTMSMILKREKRQMKFLLIA
jgi:hypothetical protein